MFVKLKGAVRYRACVSGHPAFLLSQGFDHERNTRRGFSDNDHLRDAAQWLASAQDSQADGGVAGRYRLDRGWTSSYPDTTRARNDDVARRLMTIPGVGAGRALAYTAVIDDPARFRRSSSVAAS